MTFFSMTLSNKQERSMGIGAIVVLLILIVLTIKNDFSLWWDVHHVTATPPVPAETIMTASLAEKITQIPQWHLFGAAASDQSALPGTRLQAVLSGVMMASPEQNSEAIISVAGQPAKVYRVGDALSGMSVRVHSITNDGVILENGGHLEKLSLERSPLEFHGLPKSSGG
ncbi:MAG: type II secretion system protein N [Gammaproteobacteria bacterium]|nr:type II secretion system protein N [Gammaproteobacteria bacterium]